VHSPADLRSTYLAGPYRDGAGHVEQMDGWARWSGTSFATPQVAAEIARLARGGVTARRAAYRVLASATWEPGIGPVLLPAAAGPA
jgi:hypothetical protein